MTLIVIIPLIVLVYAGGDLFDGYKSNKEVTDHLKSNTKTLKKWLITKKELKERIKNTFYLPNELVPNLKEIKNLISKYGADTEFVNVPRFSVSSHRDKLNVPKKWKYKNLVPANEVDLKLPYKTFSKTILWGIALLSTVIVGSSIRAWLKWVFGGFYRELITDDPFKDKP